MLKAGMFFPAFYILENIYYYFRAATDMCSIVLLKFATAPTITLNINRYYAEIQIVHECQD